jgi:hypothetical protein
MISVLVGIVLVIVAVILWVGSMSLAHAVAILIGLIGILVILWGLGERGGRYSRF